MFWLILLGVVTILTIVLRRVLHRQKPLDDELYSKKVAVEHVQSGVAWVRADGTFGSVNQSFARALNTSAPELIGKEWFTMFPSEEHHRMNEAYRQTLLAGVHSFDARAVRVDGSEVWLNVKLVAAHDRKMRFVGHHCLIEDRTRERELEKRIKLLTSLSTKTVIEERPGSAAPVSPAAAAR